MSQTASAVAHLSNIASLSTFDLATDRGYTKYLGALVGIPIMAITLKPIHANEVTTALDAEYKRLLDESFCIRNPYAARAAVQVKNTEKAFLAKRVTAQNGIGTETGGETVTTGDVVADQQTGERRHPTAGKGL